MFCTFKNNILLQKSITHKSLNSEKNNEKLEFLDCIDREGLILKQQINTMCEVSNLASDAFFYLHDKNRATPYDFLDQFDKPIATHKPKVSYPRNPQQRGIEGYAIVKFDLNKDGKAGCGILLFGEIRFLWRLWVTRATQSGSPINLAWTFLNFILVPCNSLNRRMYQLSLGGL